MRIKLFRSTASALLMLLAASAAAAADVAPGPLPVADFARRPKYLNVAFSPDGNRFGALQDIDGRANLIIGDLKARTSTRVTSFATYDVGSFQWISNKRLILRLYDAQKGLAEQRGGGLFAINYDGSQPKELSPTAERCESEQRICRQTRFVRRVAGSDDEVIAAANERDIKTDDLYRLNTLTGRKVLLTAANPGEVSRWVLDSQNVPRAAVSGDEVKTQIFWYRDGADTPWKKIASYTGIDHRRMLPAAFDADGSLLVFSNLDSDTFKLYDFDPTTGKTGAVVADDPLADVDVAQTTFVAPVSQGYKILGVRIEADKPKEVWFDERYAKMQALLDVSLAAGSDNEFGFLDDGRVVVHSRSDRDAGEYLLYDPVAKQLQEVLRPRDWLKPEQMAKTNVVRYKARDGMEVPAYLTLPVGKPPSKLPLVAMIHGGPFGVRDEWGFNPDVQFLANRGYAVLQPNYRGSGGYGLKYYTAGFRQWGLAMQDDVTDGVKSLIDKGIVDPARVCIMGGSYGGYAVLMGMVKEPDMFKCGIDEAGVSDLFWLGELAFSDFNQADSAGFDIFYAATVGDPSKDKASFEAHSPRLQAAKIKGNLMIVHAVRDQRVPFQHAEGMRDAMKAAGKSVEWVVYPDEAHGFIKYENRIDRYNKVEAFLKQNIGQ